MPEPVVIVGPGAIGLAVGASLIESNHEVVLCGRSQIGELVRHGMGDDLRQRVRSFAAPGEFLGEPRWAVLATKAHQTASAQPWLRAIDHPGLTVAICQNGVDHLERVGPLVEHARLLPVVVNLPAARLGPGVVEQKVPGTLTVPAGEAGTRFAQLFDSGAAITAHTDPDWLSKAWRKLMLNVASGGIGAIVRSNNSVLADPGAQRLATSLIREVIAVGRAEGAALDDDLPEKALAMVAERASGHWSSIAGDRRDGQAMEWEARNAVIGRLGRRHEIATPVNDAITTLLRLIDERR